MSKGIDYSRYPEHDDTAKRQLDIALSRVVLPYATRLERIAANRLAPARAQEANVLGVIDPIPPHIVQPRIGYGQQPYPFWKIRTMRNPLPGEPLDISKTSPRLYEGADLVRAASLDEMPQWLSVLIGDMSAVGPRLGTIEQLEHERSVLNDDGLFKARLDLANHILPGITGPGQLHGFTTSRRDREMFREIYKADLDYYEKKASLGRDMYLIGKTPLIVLGAAASQVAARLAEGVSSPTPVSVNITKPPVLKPSPTSK